MPIFERDSKKILFVHIPKTGGTTIEDIFSAHSSMTFYSLNPSPSLKVCPQHLTFSDLRILLGRDYWNQAFSIIRDPYERMESEFYFRTENQYKKFGRRPDFSAWLIDCINSVRKNPFLLDNHFRPQTDFIDSEVTIFRLEDGLDIVVDEVSKLLGIQKISEPERKNVSEKRLLEWSLDALNCINDYYHYDFEELGYSRRRKKLNFFQK